MSRQVWKVTMLAILTAATFSTAQTVGEKKPGGPDKKAGMKERMLKQFDTDGDGKLSDSEKAAMKADREAMLAKYDTDKDGKLSEEERQAIPKPEKKTGPKTVTSGK